MINGGTAREDEKTLDTLDKGDVFPATTLRRRKRQKNSQLLASGSELRGRGMVGGEGFEPPTSCL